jgi:hypothetical protein
MKKKAHVARATPRVFSYGVLAALLAACGGGSGGDSGVQPAPITLSGVAATGAPMADAAVKVTDSSGAVVCTTTAAADGSYACTLEAVARAPFAVSAQLDELRMFSATASAASATVNLTPLTTLVAARLAPDGNPDHLATALELDPSVVTADKIQAQVRGLRTTIAPLLAAVGDATDPISGRFTADGTGHDRVLDALQVSIRPEEGRSNIEITFKVRPVDDAAPPVKLAFSSDETSPPALATPIRSDDLPETGIAGLVNGFLGRATACYAEPLTQRIANVPAGAVQAIGGASDVSAPSCRGLFWNDDPASFQDNGLVVGSSGAFSGLFRESSTGVKFDAGHFEYQWANGDIYITFRTLSTSGAVGNSSLTLREQGGVLKAVGNQYRYDASIRPFAAEREFPLQPQFTWLGSGYAPAIRNAVDPASGLPLFREAQVTAPDGRQSIYRPLSGRSLLAIIDSGGLQRVNTVQFHAAVFKDASTAGHPAAKDGASGAFFTDVQLTDEQILQLPDHGVWTIRWVHADPAVADVVQTYRTLRRAPTIGELREMTFAELSAGFKAELLSRSDVAAGNAIIFGAPSATQPNVLTLATLAGGDAWVIPEGAAAPTSITAFGWRAGTGSFNDGLTIPTTARRATINCTTQAAADLHCDSSTGVLQYAEGSRVDALELWATDSRQLSRQRQVNLYRLAD